MMKYGLHLVYGNGKFWSEEILKLENYDPDVTADCLNIVQAERATSKPDYSNKRWEMVQLIRSILKRTSPPFTYTKFINALTSEEHTRLIVEIGISYKSFVTEMITVQNNANVRTMPTLLEPKLAFLHTNAMPLSDDVRDWLAKLFRNNNVHRQTFWADIQAIADMTTMKKNAFVIMGPPNC